MLLIRYVSTDVLVLSVTKGGTFIRLFERGVLLNVVGTHDSPDNLWGGLLTRGVTRGV